MRILHFSTDDITGGAAKAAYRLHTAMGESGQQSHMAVLRKRSGDDSVTQAPPRLPHPWRSRFERLTQHIPGIRRQQLVASYTFNFDLEPGANLPGLLASYDEKPDIVCLHWISGLLNVQSIRLLHERYQCPLVWVMADQEPMTGGCHYSFGCEGFTKQCGCCPQLDSKKDRDHSHRTWVQKKQSLADLPICFVAPTSWGKKKIKQSSLFRQHRIEQIPYPIDPQTFRPIDQQIARDLLHLPKDKKVLFFGATYLEDRRKGMTQLIEALSKLATLIDASKTLKRDDLFLLVAGLNGQQLMNKLPFPGKHIGHLNDELMLALAYQAADLFICPSIEDAGPMMIPEAMMCGTPVVAFQAGGAPDLVESMKSGYLAALADVDDLSRGIYDLLMADNWQTMRDLAQKTALSFHKPTIVVAHHLELYRELIAKLRNQA